jgi:hypothetical protein
LKRISIILLALILLTVSGCSKKDVVKHNYIFKGGNEFWSAEYEVNGTVTFTDKDGKLRAESKSNHILTVTYKKELSDLDSIKNLEISYESTAGGGKLAGEFNNDNPLDKKTFTMKSMSKGGAIENKDELIKVKINIDGYIQAFELKNEQ